MLHFSWCWLRRVATRILAILPLMISKSELERVTEALMTSLRQRYTYKNTPVICRRKAAFTSCDVFIFPRKVVIYFCY